MTNDVHVLKTTTSVNQAQVIQVLEACLAKARSGDFAAVAVALVQADRVTATHAWSSSDCVPALLGATTLMGIQMALEASNQASPMLPRVSS